MKRNILSTAALLIGSALLLSCNAKDPYPNISAHEVEMIQTFADIMKQDIMLNNGRAYHVHFQQQYEIAYETDNDLESAKYSYAYQGEGELTRAYRLEGSNAVKPSAGDLFSRGSAYLSGNQKENVLSSHVYSRKNENESNKNKNYAANYNLDHEFGIQWNSETFDVYGKNILVNNMKPDNNEEGSFKGSIDKSILSSYSDATINNAIGKILYLDAWSDIASIKDDILAYYGGLSLSQSNDAKKFIADHHFAFVEEETQVKYTFTLSAEEVIPSLKGKEGFDKVLIPGEAIISKQGRVISYYKYDFKDMLTGVLQLGAQGRKAFQSSVTSFNFETRLLDVTLDDLSVPGPFVTYDESSLNDFMSNLADYVFPNLSGVTSEGETIVID